MSYYDLQNESVQIMIHAKSPLQKAFANHLLLVAGALHETQKSLEEETSTEACENAIKLVLGTDYKSKCLDVLGNEAQQLINELKQFI
jgi:hypothetical protein